MQSIYDLNNKEGSLDAATASTPLIDNEEDQRIELTIKEYQEFSSKLQTECLSKHIPEIQKLSESIFNFKGLKISSSSLEAH